MVRRTMGATPTVVCFQHSHIIKRLIMLAQLALLMAFQFIGEAVTTGLGITFPGPLCGMILLLFYLFVTGGPPKELSVVGTSLLFSSSPQEPPSWPTELSLRAMGCP
jgi:hypothetical protein